MDGPTQFEIDVLRELNGERVEGMCWGAAMGEAVEWLHGSGYISRSMKNGALTYEINDAGHALLAQQAER